jgi:hypothetical protein
VLSDAEVRPSARRTFFRPSRLPQRQRVVAVDRVVNLPVPSWQTRRVDRALQRERERFAWGTMTRAERRLLQQTFIPHREGARMETRRRIVERAEARRWAPLRWVELPRWRWQSRPLLVTTPAPALVALPAFPGDVWHRLDRDLLVQRVQRLDFGPVDLVIHELDTRPVDRVLLVDRFLLLDHDRDQFLTWNEWTGDRVLFHQLDRDDDRRLVMGDLLVAPARLEPVLRVDRQRYADFHLLDLDDDRVVAPWEWSADLDVFFLLDSDGDGLVSQSEYLGLVPVRTVPLRMVVQRDLDLDADGRIEAVEWVGDPYRFARLDIDADGVIEPLESLAGWALTA